VPGTRLSERLLPLLVQEPSELSEEAVSDILNIKGFLVVDSYLIPVLEALRFDLKDVGVDLPFPEPVCAAELNAVGMSRRDVFQVLKQPSACHAVLEAQSDVSYPVRDRCNAIANGQTLRVVAIFLSRMDEMAVATLESETEVEFLKRLHNVNNGSIDAFDIHGGQGCFPLSFVAMVIDQASAFREGFHLLSLISPISDYEDSISSPS